MELSDVERHVSSLSLSFSEIKLCLVGSTLWWGLGQIIQRKMHQIRIHCTCSVSEIVFEHFCIVIHLTYKQPWVIQTSRSGLSMVFRSCQISTSLLNLKAPRRPFFAVWDPFGFISSFRIDYCYPRSGKASNPMQGWRSITISDNHIITILEDRSAWSPTHNAYTDRLLNTSLLSSNVRAFLTDGLSNVLEWIMLLKHRMLFDSSVRVFQLSSQRVYNIAAFYCSSFT